MWLRQFIYVAQSFFQERMLFRFYFSCMNSNPSRNQHFNKFISHAHTTETFNFIWVQFFFLQWIIIAVCCSGSLLLPTTILIYIFLLRFNCFISKNFPFALESLKKNPNLHKMFYFCLLYNFSAVYRIHFHVCRKGKKLQFVFNAFSAHRRTVLPPVFQSASK